MDRLESENRELNGQSQRALELLAANTLKLDQLEKRQYALSIHSERIQFELDSNATFYKYLVLNDRKLSIQRGASSWFPILLSRLPIRRKQHFDIELTKFTVKLLAVGITIFDSRNK